MLNDAPELSTRAPGQVMAFLQARMGSRRLPGKVLTPIHGRSLLERALWRLRASPAVDAAVVLTTTRPDDDAVADEARRLGVPVYRGAEDDVLDRYYECARRFGPDIVIRATADNPLIDIGSIERMVAALRAAPDLDYCGETGLPYGAATEALTLRALERTHGIATEPSHREHVTLYIKEHPEAFKLRLLSAPPEVTCPALRVTVDTAEDLDRVTRLIGLLPEVATPRPLTDYIVAAEKLL